MTTGMSPPDRRIRELTPSGYGMRDGVPENSTVGEWDVMLLELAAEGARRLVDEATMILDDAIACVVAPAESQGPTLRALQQRLGDALALLSPPVAVQTTAEAPSLRHRSA